MTHEEVKQWAEDVKDGISTKRIHVISHAWESCEHADPFHFQIGRVAKGVKKDDWIFYDFISLYQFLRTDEQQEVSFRRAMGNMNLLYCHEHTVTLRIEDLTPAEIQTESKQKTCKVYHVASASCAEVRVENLKLNATPYLERGWCAAEMQWSQSRSSTDSFWRLSDAGLDLLEAKRAPMPPDLFLALAKEGKLRFTHRSDLDPVLALQEKFFLQKASTCESLSMSRLEPDSWRSVEVCSIDSIRLRIVFFLGFILFI